MKWTKSYKLHQQQQKSWDWLMMSWTTTFHNNTFKITIWWCHFNLHPISLHHYNWRIKCKLVTSMSVLNLVMNHNWRTANEWFLVRENGLVRIAPCWMIRHFTYNDSSNPQFKSFNIKVFLHLSSNIHPSTILNTQISYSMVVKLINMVVHSTQTQ